MKLSELTKENIDTLSSQELAMLNVEIIKWISGEAKRYPPQKIIPHEIQVGHPFVAYMVHETYQLTNVPKDYLLDHLLALLDRIYQAGYVHGKEDTELVVGRG